jgi:hypothetical protein
MTPTKYATFAALGPFFDIIQQGLAGLVDGDHYFETIATALNSSFAIFSLDGLGGLAVVTR